MRSSVLLATLCCASVLGRDWSFKEFFVGEWDMERHTKGAMFALSRWVLTQRTPPKLTCFSAVLPFVPWLQLARSSMRTIRSSLMVPC